MADQRDVDVKIDGNKQADPHKQQASSSKGKAQSTDNQESKPLIVPEGLSLDQRDPQGLHDEDHSDLKVSFPDIFAEPTGLHSDDKVWVCTYKTYNGSKFLCYRICTYICAVPAAFIWGITFACLAFCHIWYVVPFLKAFLIELKCIGKVFMLCVKSFCDPIYTSIGLIYSRIRVNFIRSDGNGGGQYPV